MDRRELLKQLLVLTSGMIGAPSISFSGTGLVTTGKLALSEDAKRLVYKLCGIIIPSDGNVKGADDLLIGDFVLLMVNDCRTPEDQERFGRGLQTLLPTGRSFKSKDPSEFDNQDWNTYLTAVLTAKDQGTAKLGIDAQRLDDLYYFVNTVKQLTIQGFTTCKYFMTEIMPYEMFPGGFKGKVKIQPGEKVNIYG